MDKRKAKKVTVFIYIAVVVFCFLIGTASSSVYKRLPAMQARYEAEIMQSEYSEEGKRKQPQKYHDEEINKDVLEDFVYAAFYKPIRSINNSWKSHVGDSLQVERRRVIGEKYRE